MIKKISRKKELNKLYLNVLRTYNAMDRIASIIGPKTLNKCRHYNKELGELITSIKQNLYLIEDPIIEIRIEDLIYIADDFFKTVKKYNPKAKDDMENRLYLVLTNQTYGKEIIDMYQHDQIPDNIYEKFNFRQGGRVIIDQDSNRYEKK